jgi:hypothetical protein
LATVLRNALGERGQTFAAALILIAAVLIVGLSGPARLGQREQ